MKNYSKHTMFAMVAVLATSLFSCTKDDNDGGSAGADASAIEKTNVPFTLTNAPSSSSLTGKDIKRGTIDVKIKSIDLQATKLWTTGGPQLFNYEVHDTFNILNSNQTGYSAADANISLAAVAIGSNKFTASTTAAGAQVSEALMYPSPFLDDVTNVLFSEAKLAILKAHTPYAVYTGETNADIFKPDVAANNVVIPMHTNNGRILASFYLSDLLVKLEYTATLTITTKKANGAIITTFPSKDIVKNNVVTFEWSDANSVAGAYAEYKFEIKEKNNPTVFYTYTWKDANTTIAGEISRSCRYVVEDSTVKVNLEGVDGFKFTTPWTETDCPTCPNVTP